MTQVLVADDSESIRMMVSAMLSPVGYQVQEAPDGVEALNALRAKEEPMVVLLDYHMPNMDGFEVLQAAVADGNMLTHNEYIIITAAENTFPPDFIELLRHLSIRVLPKPFHKDTLTDAVAQAAERLTAPVEVLPTPTDSEN